MIITREQIEAHIQCILNCYPDGCRYEEQRDGWVARILAHDAALRQQLEEAESYADDVDKVVVQLSTELAAVREESADLKAQLREETQRNINIQSAKDLTIEGLRAEVTGLEHQKHELRQMNMDSARLEQIVAEQSQEVRLLDEKVSDLEDHLTQKEQQLADLQAKCEQLEQEVYYLKDKRN